MSDRPYQYDMKTRVVCEDVLRGMCEHVSGHAHRWYIEKITDHRCRVVYDNPDEYGRPHPMVAIYPAWRVGKYRYIALGEIIDVEHDSWDGQGEQAFWTLEFCPTLYLDAENHWHEFVATEVPAATDTPRPAPPWQQ